MLDKNIYETVISDLIRWYRDHDFSEMRKDARNEILDIYVENGKPLIQNAKYQIAINIHFIAIAYNDDVIFNIEDEVMNANTKNELKEILYKISNLLKEEKYTYPSLSPYGEMK